jgi:hypothetical protein
MSVYVKKITGQAYVYFEWYQGGKKIEEYIGRKDDPEILLKLLAKYNEHQEYDLGKFCSRIEEVTGFKVNPKEARRRLRESLPLREVEQVTRIKPRNLPAFIDIDMLKTKLEVTDIAFEAGQVELRGRLPKEILRKIEQEKADETRDKDKAN